MYRSVPQSPPKRYLQQHFPHHALADAPRLDPLVTDAADLLVLGNGDGELKSSAVETQMNTYRNTAAVTILYMVGPACVEPDFGHEPTCNR